jgi:hypothetical protein
MDQFLGAKYFAIAVPSITDETGLKSFSALVIFITVLPSTILISLRTCFLMSYVLPVVYVTICENIVESKTDI